MAAETFIAEPPKELVLEEGFRFTHGQTLAPFTIRYETFGTLKQFHGALPIVCAHGCGFVLAGLLRLLQSAQLGSRAARGDLVSRTL